MISTMVFANTSLYSVLGMCIVCVCVFSKDAIVYSLSYRCVWSARLFMFNEFPDALL